MPGPLSQPNGMAFSGRRPADHKNCMQSLRCKGPGCNLRTGKTQTKRASRDKRPAGK